MEQALRKQRCVDAGTALIWSKIGRRRLAWRTLSLAANNGVPVMRAHGALTRAERVQFCWRPHERFRGPPVVCQAQAGDRPRKDAKALKRTGATA